MLLISKKQLIPTNANLAMVFIWKLSQSRLQIGQFEWIFPDLAHVKAIAVLFMPVQYLAETLLRKIRRGKTRSDKKHGKRIL